MAYILHITTVPNVFVSCLRSKIGLSVVIFLDIILEYYPQLVMKWFIHSLLLSLLLLLLLSSLSSLLLLSNQLTVMNITQATSHCVRLPVEQFDDCSGNGANKHGLRQNTLIDKNHIVNFGNDYRPSFSNKSSHSLDLLEMFGSHELKTILHS